LTLVLNEFYAFYKTLRLFFNFARKYLTPNLMYRTHTCGELRIENVGQQVTLAGWIQRIRDLGSMVFIDLRDRYGITQLYFDNKLNPELMEQARKLGREYVLQVSGKVRERESKNPKLPTGDIEIVVEKLTVLNKSELPPFIIEGRPDPGIVYKHGFNPNLSMHYPSKGLFFSLDIYSCVYGEGEVEECSITKPIIHISCLSTFRKVFKLSFEVSFTIRQFRIPQ
jgi:hypothetical protein